MSKEITQQTTFKLTPIGSPKYEKIDTTNIGSTAIILSDIDLKEVRAVIPSSEGTRNSLDIK